MAQLNPQTFDGPGQPAPPGQGPTTSNPPSAATGAPTPAPLRSLPAHHAASGVAIQCQFCVGQRFRRSRLRAADLKHLLLMRYPVRCLFCNQRQMVSFTVAGVSLPSHVSQPEHRKRSSRKN